MDLLDPSSLPPGFGFHPTDVELISHYLKRKILGIKNEMEVIPVVDIYKYEPWDLPAKSRIPSREGKWHFFNTRDRKYQNGFRSNRATEAGYWKSTGKDRVIRVQKRAIGTKKTLVFHQGRPPRGRRTEWIMHEYYLDDNEYKNADNPKDMYVLCRVTKRTGLVPDAENVSDLVEKEDSPLSAEVLDDTLELSDNFLEPPTLSKADIDALIAELYDPNVSAMSASTKLGKQEVDSAVLAPKIEPEVLSPAADAYGDQLSTGMMTYNFDDFNLEWFPSEFRFEGINPVYHQSHVEEKATLLDQNEYFDATSILETCHEGVGGVKNDMHCGFGFNQCGTLAAMPETGIQIRERRHETFAEPTGHRIRLQIHKMEAHNNRASDETHVFISDDHRLASIDLGKDTIDSKTNDILDCEGPKTPDRNDHKAYRRTSQHHSQNNPEKYCTTEYGHANDFSPYYQYEDKQSPPVSATKHRFTGDSRFHRDDVRRLLREARKGARSVIHRYTSMARSCLFIGACLVGTTAWSTFIQEVF